MKKFKKKAERFFVKNEKFFYAFLVAIGFSFYLLMPGCGGSKNNNNAATTVAPVCIPGQPCQGGIYGSAQGIPLIPGPTFSALDQMGSQMVLTWAAPQYNAGQAYNGPVNVNGLLRLAPGRCYGAVGDYQIQGQGSWSSGYAGATAGVQAQLQIVGGGSTQYNPYGQAPAGGSVIIQTALIRDIGGGQFTLSQGYGVCVSMCNSCFAFYN